MVNVSLRQGVVKKLKQLDDEGLICSDSVKRLIEAESYEDDGS
jgi:hypothetical protein